MSKSKRIVVGSGLAGLSFALEAAENGEVTILTKSSLTESNTSYAQGGIAAAVGEADSWKLHERDTLIAGAGLCDPAAVRFLVQHAPEGIEWLQSMGARFDRTENGFALGREGGHSRKRIVHHQDRTGWEVERAISEAIKSHPRIEVIENAFATNLILDSGACVGVEAMVESLGARTFFGDSVFLATGGCGQMYRHTTNPKVATSDGIALALRAGAKVKNMEFMQFHPTTLYHPQARSFLISEAVRGAGATLRNHLGRRFMYDYDDRLELAPRDIVARSIEAEIAKHDTWCVYLDAAHLNGDQLKEEFPMIYQRLQAIDIEMEKDFIPVAPAQHYSCGGVVTDLDGQTSVANLFAGGEVACTGVHGANRLASNSLLEALVFSRQAAHAANRVTSKPNPTSTISEWANVTESESVRIRRAVQRCMTKHAGIVRTDAGLAEAARILAQLMEEHRHSPKATFAVHPSETWNLLQSAQVVVQSAQARKANVGLHYNRDYPPAELIGDPSLE